MKRLIVLILLIVLFSGVARAWDEKAYFAEREQVSIPRKILMDAKNIPTEIKAANPCFVQSSVVIYGGLTTMQDMVRGKPIPYRWRRNLLMYWLAKRGGGIG